MVPTIYNKQATRFRKGSGENSNFIKFTMLFVGVFGTAFVAHSPRVTPEATRESCHSGPTAERTGFQTHTVSLTLNSMRERELCCTLCCLRFSKYGRQMQIATFRRYNINPKESFVLDQLFRKHLYPHM